MGRFWYTTSTGERKRTKAGLRREYKEFQSSPKQIAERSARNSARRSAVEKGLVHKGDGKDVHHSHGINSNTGLVVMSASKNRGIHEKSRKRGSKRSRYGGQ